LICWTEASLSESDAFFVRGQRHNPGERPVQVDREGPPAACGYGHQDDTLDQHPDKFARFL